MSKTFIASSTLIGTVIGAGILGIPYVVMQSGFSIGLINLIVLAAIMILTTLYLGEISLRTKQTHQLTGYAAKYLGKKGKLIMFLAFTFGILAALLAYIIGEADSFSYIFFNSGAYSLHLGIAFWAIMTLITYSGIKALKEGEEIGVILILILVISITVFAWNKIDPTNLQYTNLENLFLPFGVILFAYLGFAAIPELRRIIGEEGKLMKKTIWISYIVIFIIYAVFAAIVLGFKGTETPQIATIALGKPFILLGIITMFTSYLALSIAFIDTLRFDYNMTKTRAWIYTSITPLVLFLLLKLTNTASFVKVLGIGGVISGGITAVLILFMVKAAKKKGDRKPEYKIPYSNLLTWILIAIFTIGAVFEIAYSF